MAQKQVPQFNLSGEVFKEYGVQAKYAQLDQNQLIARISEQKPPQFDVDFDGSIEASIFLAQLAESTGYLLDIEDQLAVFNRP